MAACGRRKTVPGPRAVPTRSERQLLRLLQAGLSEVELDRVLACAVLTLERGGGMERLVKRLGDGTGETLRALLAARAAGARPAGVTPGAGKIAEEWRRVWSEWDECILESGVESGRYVLQEHSWECPFLDLAGLSDDLDRIAARARPLIPRVVDEALDSDFCFRELLERTDSTVAAGLPEWMDGLGDGLYLGMEATMAFLEWEWLTVSGKRGAVRTLHERVDAVTGALCNLRFDHRALEGFFGTLP